MVVAVVQSQEMSLSEMWNEAQQNFSAKTSKSLKRVSLDEALDLINKRVDMEDTDEPSKKQKLKAVANDVMNLINLLGGIAAQGVSMVFGPANLCFNAIQFLMDIPKMISKFYDDIQKLLSTVATFLKQFRIYQRIEDFKSLDQELLYSTHKLMITFINICALSMQIFDGRKRTTAKITAKLVLFGNDSGVEAGLDEFHQLVEHHSRIENAITLEHVMKAEYDAEGRHKQLLQHLCEQAEATAEMKENVGFLYQQATTQSIKDQWQKHKVKIMEKLAIDRSQQERIKDFDPAQGEDFPKDPYKDFQQLLRTVVPSTGDWLEELPSFQQWVDTRSESNIAILLSGEPGTGKSCVAATIIDNLKRAHPETESTVKRRVSIACYNFDRPVRVSRGAVDRRSSTLALKSIAFQIAEQNFKYAQALAGQLDNKHVSFSRDLDPKALANILLEPFALVQQPEAKLYLVFDSLDKLSQEDRDSFWDAVFHMKSQRVRIAVTGDEEAFQNANITQDHSEIIELTKHNENDLQNYIAHKVKEEDAFRDQAVALSKASAKITKELPLIAKGNFGNVDYILDKVVAAFNDDETAEYIASLVDSETLNSKNQDVGLEINKLNNSLNVREIEQLNELLIWALYAVEPISIEEMNSALILHLQKATNLDLRKKIERKFSKVLKVISLADNEIVAVKDDDVEKYFRESSRALNTSSGSRLNDEPTISMEIRINNAKLTHVKKFLWDLSKKTVLENFENIIFDDSALGADTKLVISASKVDSELALVRRCFDLLLDEVEDEARTLCRYAVNYLPLHLYNLREDVVNGDLSLTERQEVLKLLLDLLRSPDKVEKYLDGQFLWQRAWLDEERGVEALKSWLSDQDAAGKLRRSEQNWIRAVNEKNATASLLNFAMIVAQIWLCKRTAFAEDPYSWLNQYIEQVQKPSENDLARKISKTSKADDSPGDVVSDAKPGNEDSLDLKQCIDRAIEWVKSNTNINTETSLCFERIGETYLWFDNFEEAKDAYSKAEKAEDSSWKAFEGSAKACAGVEDFDTAINKMKIVLEQLQLDDQKERSQEDIEQLSNNLVLCARWEEKLGRYQSAIEKLQSSIKIAPNDYSLCGELLRVYVDADRLPEATEFLTQLHETVSENESQPNKLSSMLLATSWWVESLSCFGTVLHVASHGNMMNVILDTIESLLTKAREDGDDDALPNLLLFHGILLSRQQANDNSRQTALTQWKECCDCGLHSEVYVRQHRALSAARRVFTYYIHEIRIGNILSDEMPQVTEYLEGLGQRLATGSDYEQLMKYLLASFHVVAGQEDKARNLLMNDMKSGLNLLCDDTEENDWIGYRMIWPILLHVGKYPDALTAISLYGPAERHGVDHSHGFFCDGHETSDGKGSWSQDMWICTMCDDLSFCDECLEQLKNGTLKTIVCSPDHYWVRAPAWDNEYKEFGKDYVRVGGTIQDGRRVGGEKVLVKEWLESLKKEWGYVKQDSGTNAQS